MTFNETWYTKLFTEIDSTLRKKHYVCDKTFIIPHDAEEEVKTEIVNKFPNISKVDFLYANKDTCIIRFSNVDFTGFEEAIEATKTKGKDKTEKVKGIGHIDTYKEPTVVVDKANIFLVVASVLCLALLIVFGICGLFK